MPSHPKQKKTTTIEPATDESTRAEYAVNAEPPVVTDQAAVAQNTPSPPSEDPQNISPLPSQGEGYDYGITLDSMIMTPMFLIC